MQYSVCAVQPATMAAIAAAVLTDVLNDRSSSYAEVCDSDSVMLMQTVALQNTL